MEVPLCHTNCHFVLALALALALAVALALALAFAFTFAFAFVRIRIRIRIRIRAGIDSSPGVIGSGIIASISRFLPFPTGFHRCGKFIRVE